MGAGSIVAQACGCERSGAGLRGWARGQVGDLPHRQARGHMGAGSVVAQACGCEGRSKTCPTAKPEDTWAPAP